jgi:hypothetical protein
MALNLNVIVVMDFMEKTASLMVSLSDHFIYTITLYTLDPKLSARADANSKSIGVAARSKSKAFAEVRAPSKHKYTAEEEDKHVANDNELTFETSDQQQKSKSLL